MVGIYKITSPSGRVESFNKDKIVKSTNQYGDYFKYNQIIEKQAGNA